MNLNEIVDQILDIAISIGYNNISYFHPLLAAKKRRCPEDLLTAIAAPLKNGITNGTPPTKKELTKALGQLNDIEQTYHIKELQKPIADLKAYLNSLS